MSPLICCGLLCCLRSPDEYMPRGCRKNFVPVSPFHYGEDGRLHVVFMGSGYYAAQVTPQCHGLLHVLRL